MAAPSLIEILEGFLDSQKMLAKPSQAGLMVLPAEGGAFICSVDETGMYRSFSKTELAFMKKWDIRLDASLGRNGETVRRADMLNNRQQQPGMQAWESLDDHPNKQTMPNLARGDTAREIPRIYGAVDVSDAKHPQIVLYASEFGVDAPAGSGAKIRRLDEAVLKFDIDEDLAKKIVKGEVTVKQALATVRAKNAQVIYYDNNRELTGRARVDHNIKSIETLESWLKALPTRFGIKFSGLVQAGCVDVLESALGVQVEEGAKPGATDQERLDQSRKDPQRRSAARSLPPPGSTQQETILLVTLGVDASGGGPAKVTRVKSQRFARFKTAFSAAEVAEIEVRFAKFVRAASAAIRRAG